MGERQATEVADSLKGLPGVGDVVVDQQRLKAIQKNGRILRSALGSLGLLLLLGAGFSTGNVIRMSVISREEEITIMRLVGATESFIRTPMVVEGALLGLAASVLAILGLFVLWLPLARGAGHLSPLLVDLARLGFFSTRSLLLLGLVGMATGALGALWGFWSTQRIQAQGQAEETA
jgi:cell division transport system permease protein